MQVLSDALARRMSGRIINIHHSFLPSFKGGQALPPGLRPGSKLVGATAHYVTADLDEGPIIEQDVTRVDHRMTADDLVLAGEEVESRVLARAVKWHCDSRVLLNVDRTVVFYLTGARLSAGVGVGVGDGADAGGPISRCRCRGPCRLAVMTTDGSAAKTILREYLQAQRQVLLDSSTA